MSAHFKVYNPTDNDQLKEPMFFGQNVNVARYDQQRHSIFEKLIERQLALFWRPEEFDLTKDRADYAALPEHEKHIFISNLKYQILLDSIQGRGPSAVLAPIASLPEVETWINTWNFFEGIHSRSYTHIIRNIVSDPSIIFDDIVPNPQIAARAASVGKLYDDLVVAIDQWRRKEIPVREAKKALMLCMAAINILEGVRFYVSFVCSFNFAERKVMEGNAKVIRAISRDEAVHLASTQHIFRIWREGRDDPEMQELYEELKPQIREITLDAAEQEKDWTAYLFKDGSMIGLNKKILDEYIEHITDQRLTALGLLPEFGSKPLNLPWMKNWLSSEAVQVAPQETEITSYLTSAVDSNLDMQQLKEFKI